MNYLETSDIAPKIGVANSEDQLSDPVGIPEVTAPDTPQEPASREESRTAQALSHLEEVMAGLGGEMVIHAQEGGLVKFSVHFQSTPAVIQRMEALLHPSLSASNAGTDLCEETPQTDSEVNRILKITKQFMHAFCQGDLEECREVLRQVADKQPNHELFLEIGQLAREFHTSLSQLTETLDPAFRVIVEEKLPDSGSRLEHILEITENAANTTLDKVEAMQGRNETDIEQVRRLQDLLGNLTALGPMALSSVSEATDIAMKLASSMTQTRDDLVSILMAQDFQDLTGQIIQRVLTLLKDLETKLVNVVKVFGGRGEHIECEGEVLYGPAHKGKTEALHSQDDVDSLLADFGF
ncbi:MAG: protein phosphatase CheZ [Syntrophobacteraceae bacterium]